MRSRHYYDSLVGMEASLFQHSSSTALKPNTHHFTVRGNTGVGPDGRHAVTVTENAYRGPWCHDCEAKTCDHVATVHAARVEGKLPPLDPITDRHLSYDSENGGWVPLVPQ